MHIQYNHKYLQMYIFYMCIYVGRLHKLTYTLFNNNQPNSWDYPSAMENNFQFNLDPNTSIFIYRLLYIEMCDVKSLFEFFLALVFMCVNVCACVIWYVWTNSVVNILEMGRVEMIKKTLQWTIFFLNWITALNVCLAADVAAISFLWIPYLPSPVSSVCCIYYSIDSLFYVFNVFRSRATMTDNNNTHILRRLLASSVFIHRCICIVVYDFFEWYTYYITSGIEKGKMCSCFSFLYLVIVASSLLLVRFSPPCYSTVQWKKQYRLQNAHSHTRIHTPSHIQGHYTQLTAKKKQNKRSPLHVLCKWFYMLDIVMWKVQANPSGFCWFLISLHSVTFLHVTVNVGRNVCIVCVINCNGFQLRFFFQFLFLFLLLPANVLETDKCILYELWSIWTHSYVIFYIKLIATNITIVGVYFWEKYNWKRLNFPLIGIKLLGNWHIVIFDTFCCQCKVRMTEILVSS